MTNDKVERVYQCGSCEDVFENPTKDNECPNCGSGNWIEGYIDEE